MGEDVYIVPTILTNDPQVFAEQLQAYPQFAKRIQIDLMDGTFTADKSLPESTIAGLPQGVSFDHSVSCMPRLARIYPHSLVNLKKLVLNQV